MIVHAIALFALACILVFAVSLAYYLGGERRQRTIEARLAAITPTAEGDRIITRVVAAIVGSAARAERDRLFAARRERPSPAP